MVDGQALVMVESVDMDKEAADGKENHAGGVLCRIILVNEKNACVLLRLQRRVHAAKQHTSYVHPCGTGNHAGRSGSYRSRRHFLPESTL